MIGVAYLISARCHPPERNNSGRPALPAVARFFFHFHDGTDQPDLTGTEFASLKSARDAAVVFMGEKLRELDGDF